MKKKKHKRMRCTLNFIIAWGQEYYYFLNGGHFTRMTFTNITSNIFLSFFILVAEEEFKFTHAHKF